MTHIDIHHDLFSITFEMWQKVWGLHGDFKLPKDEVISVTKEKPSTAWFEWRMPGTFFPGLIKAGTYFTKRGKEYWYVTKSLPHVVNIRLANNSYKGIVLGFATESDRDAAYATLTS